MKPIHSDPQPTSPSQSDAGLGLLEVMMALTVLTVVMTILFSSFVSGSLLSRVSKDKHRALLDATALMEQMSVIPIANVGATFPHATDIPEFNDLHVPGQRVQVLYANGNPALRPLEYQVVCTWTSTGGFPGRLVVDGVRAR